MSYYNSTANLIESHDKATSSTQFLRTTDEDSVKLYRGIGAEIDKDLTVDEQCLLSGLNWTVATSPIKYGTNFGHESDYKKALYREDTGKLLDTVGKNWKPYQNFQIVESFNSFCFENGLEIDHLGSLDDGRCIFATARLNSSFALSGDDIINGKILLSNYHKSGCGLTVSLMTVRKICTNGLTLPVRVGKKVISHVSSFDPQRVAAVLEAAKTNFVEFKDTAEFLAQKPITDAEAMLLLIKAFGNPTATFEDQPTVVQTCFNLFKGEGVGSNLLSSYQTAWGLLNAVTQHQNHHSIQRGGVATHLNSLWLGSKAQKQAGFMQQLVSVYQR